MKRTVLALLITACVLSCAKSQPLGPGVSVDKQGNLVIDAPLYVIERYSENREIKPADASLNRQVTAFLLTEDIDIPLECTGGIVNGRLSLTIKKPDESQLSMSLAYSWDIPAGSFTSGAEVKIGEVRIFADRYDDCTECPHPWLMLINNPLVELIDSGEVDIYWVNGDRHYFTYSLGDIALSGRVSKTRWHSDYDLNMRQGWNVIRCSEIYDEALQQDIYTTTSTPLSPDAVWVLWE